MNRYLKLLICLIAFTFSIKIFAQQLQIFEVFPGTYPVITLEFKVWDKDGNEVRNYNANDIQV
ncbi:MAG: hypothetical protein ACK42G_07880, partial [Candidatus Kapaibacteriota bacterium]